MQIREKSGFDTTGWQTMLDVWRRVQGRWRSMYPQAQECGPFELSNGSNNTLPDPIRPKTWYLTWSDQVQTSAFFRQRILVHTLRTLQWRMIIVMAVTVTPWSTLRKLRDPCGWWSAHRSFPRPGSPPPRQPPTLPPSLKSSSRSIPCILRTPRPSKYFHLSLMCCVLEC